MQADPHETSERRPEVAKDAAAEALLAAANEALARAPIPSYGEPNELPVVYVVGAPRSGTTLAHQLLARHLPLGYVDNVTARFWLRPAVGVALSRELLGGPGGRRFELASWHGVTAGAAGPHEFGYFWRHWLRLDEAPTHHLDERREAAVDVDGLRRALADLRAAWGAPVVFKNVVCGFHAHLLTRVHPASVFVHVARDLEVVARSILQARLERYGTYEAWWSLKPSTWPFEGAGPAEQAVRQAIDCRAEIAAELERAGVNSLTIDYEALCADPPGFVARVREALNRLGSDLAPTGAVPASLRASRGPRLPDHLEREIRAQVLSAR